MRIINNILMGNNKTIFFLELPARYHPKLIFLVAGLVATHKLKSEIMKEAKSVNKWAASVAIANEFAKYPP
jgi:hypothetical protein